jgi:hypothetical protein
MELITSLASTTDRRNKEYITAQLINSTCNLIENIHVLTEDKSVKNWLNIPKLNITITEKRPLFRDLVNYSNTLGDEKVIIISNADIIIDNTMSNIKFSESKIGYCLTRWVPDFNHNIVKYKPWSEFPCDLSFDTWVLKTPIYHVKNLGFELGNIGCDHRFAYELWDAGYNVINPSKLIRTLHVHESNERFYTEDTRLHGNYLGIRSTSNLEYSEDNLIFGWYEGDQAGAGGIWPHLWRWIQEIEDIEFWGRNDIPEIIRCHLTKHEGFDGYRKRPLDMKQAKIDWNIEFKRRCEEDPRYDDKGNWLGVKKYE